MIEARRGVGGWLGAAGLLLALIACAPLPAESAVPSSAAATIGISPTPAVPAPAGSEIAAQPGQSVPYPAVTPTPDRVSLPWGDTATPGPPPPDAPRFPTLQAATASGPAAGTDCSAVFPLAAVGRIATSTLTLEQVIAAFGPVDHVGGRPPVYRFVAEGCVLRVTAGMTHAQAAELAPYTTLGQLADEIGSPEAAVSVPASLRLPGRDRLALLYPTAGVIALFEHAPLALADRIDTLQVVPAGTLDDLLAELGPESRLIPGWTLPQPLGN